MLGTTPKPNRWMVIFRLLALLVVLGIILWGGFNLIAPKPDTAVVSYKLPFPFSDSIRAFGQNVLYYDGANIHCTSTTGTVRWSFPIGSGAGFDCNDRVVAAWAGSTIYILDQNGNSSYNDNLGDSIQFARVGTQYVAAIVGDTVKSYLIVKDHTGAHMDEEAAAYEDLIILDVGFYGKNGEYMWTLALDVFGTAANTVMNTFEVGKMNTGEVNLGESITYDVVYEDSRLRVVGTRSMKTFNHRGTEDTAQNVLVYGWRMIGHEVSERGDALLLFAPTSQTENQFDIRELRLINGSNDRRYSLPNTCIGGLIWGRTLYAFSNEVLYRAGMSDSRFSEYALPLPRAATRVIDVTTNGRAIVACGDEVYALTLPTAN